MTHNETMLTVSLAALLGMPGTAHSGQAAPKGEAPTIEYLVKNVDFEINTQFQSGPNIKTEVSSNTKMVLTTSAIHNYSRDLLFVVVELDGYDQTKKRRAAQSGSGYAASGAGRVAPERAKRLRGGCMVCG
jgi:hypothetical protein